MVDTSLTSCEASVAANEPLYGTMTPYRYWFLLEYNRAFDEKAWESAAIPQAVKDKIDAFPDSRPLLIRQPGQPDFGDKQVSLYIVDAAAETPHHYKIYSRDYAALLKLDFEAILRGDVTEASTTPLYLVCTNGKRDLCCATHGLPLYKALSQIEGERVWQCSHYGGHRFAGVALIFPHALSYGRLDDSLAQEVVHSYKDGIVLLNHFRARAIIPHVAQAAEYFLRRELNQNGLSALTYRDHQQSDTAYTVRFSGNGRVYAVHLEDAAPLEVLSTTGKPKTKHIPQYRFVRVETS